MVIDDEIHARIIWFGPKFITWSILELGLPRTSFIQFQVVLILTMKRSLIRHCQSRASLHGKLRSLLSEGKVEEVDISKYTTDWTNLYHGGSIVVKPSTTEDVVKTINFCRQEKMSIVPQGGNTGLVGGQVGFKNEVIMSMEKMNKILSIDTISAIAVVEAGCILEVLNKETEKVGFILPLDLGAKGSCQIGGNVATNAGGLRLLRYGSLHQNIVGLEVVKADGSVLNMLRTLHKDNCGYHLKNMFVGSEGTLGVITKVAIQLRPLPTSIQVSIVKVSSIMPHLSMYSSLLIHFESKFHVFLY